MMRRRPSLRPRRVAAERFHLLGSGWVEVVVRRDGDAFAHGARVVLCRVGIEFAGPPRVHRPHGEAGLELEADVGGLVPVTLRGQIRDDIIEKPVGQLHTVEVNLLAAIAGVPDRDEFNRVVGGVGQVELRGGGVEGAIGPPTTDRLADAGFDDVTVLADLRRLDTHARQDLHPAIMPPPRPLRMPIRMAYIFGGWSVDPRNRNRVKEVPHEPELCKMRIRQGNSMGDTDAHRDPDDCDYNSDERAIQFDYEIALVDGEQGRRLAIEQAYAVLEVLEWFGRQAPPPTR